MKHRIALAIDGSELTVTVDDVTRTFALGDRPHKEPGKALSKKVAPTKRPTAVAATTVTESPTTTGMKPTAKPAARRTRGRAAAAVAPATTAEIRAWSASTGDYPALSARGPLPRSLRDAYAAAHRGR